MGLVKLPNEGDWVAMRQAIQKLDKKLGPNSHPTFSTISIKDGASFSSDVVILGDVAVNGAGVFSTLAADSAIITSFTCVSATVSGLVCESAVVSSMVVTSGFTCQSATISTMAVTSAFTCATATISSLTVASALVVDTTTLVVDATNNRVGIGTTTPQAALHMGNDKLVAMDVNSGLTASTISSQGQGALVAQVNEISTVANKDDVVTLPSVISGVMVEIINNGDNTLLIFPASGNNLGLGLNVAEELEANERVGFVAYTSINWAKEFSTEIIHAEIHDEDNTDAFVINVKTDFHSYHTNGLVAGDLADWAFDAGGAGTSHAIISVANSAGSPGTQILVTTSEAHGLSVGDIISQANLTDPVYVGVFKVKATAALTTYEVTAAYTATDTGTIDQAATLTADAVAAGVYSFAYYISATPVSPNETFDFQLYVETIAVTGSKIRRKFGAASDFGSMSGGGVVAVRDGDKISFALSNEDSSANLIIRNLTIVLVRL